MGTDTFPKRQANISHQQTPEQPGFTIYQNPQASPPRQTHCLIMQSTNRENLGVRRSPPATPSRTNTIIHQGHQGLLTEDLKFGPPTPRQHPAHIGCQLPIPQPPTQGGDRSLQTRPGTTDDPSPTHSIPCEDD